MAFCATEDEILLDSGRTSTERSGCDSNALSLGNTLSVLASSISYHSAPVCFDLSKVKSERPPFSVFCDCNILGFITGVKRFEYTKLLPQVELDTEVKGGTVVFDGWFAARRSGGVRCSISGPLRRLKTRHNVEPSDME